MIISCVGKIALTFAIVGVVPGRVEDPFVPSNIGEINVKSLETAGTLVSFHLATRQ